MKKILQLRYLAPQLIRLLLLTGVIATVVAQEVSIPDPALKSSIWESLGRPLPIGGLTEQDVLSLTVLDAKEAGVQSLEGLEGAHNLTTLNLSFNELTSLSLPAGLTNLTYLDLSFNQLTSLTLPADLTSLTALWLSENQLTTLSLPAALNGLTELRLGGNEFTDFSFLLRFPNLTYLDFGPPSRAGLHNPLTSLTLPASLTSLTTLDLRANQLTTLILSAGLTSLTTIDLSYNPLRILVLPAPLAEARLSGLVARLKAQRVSIFTYPSEAVSLFPGRWTAKGSFEFLLTGPIGTYRIVATEDFSTWDVLNPVVNVNGLVAVTDPSAHSRTRGFYRALLSNE